ncbi:hypothetical protein GCM10028791_03470 [Echinicola sediminis]
MEWAEVQQLQGNMGQKVLRLEEVLSACQGKIEVMIDNKMEGFNKRCFNRLLGLLDHYELREGALMIGTEASTEFFTGKVKLSCTKKQIEENKRRMDYQPNNYYLFSSNIDRSDMAWAKQNCIQVVAAVNAWAFNKGKLKKAAKRSIVQMKRAGVTCFQIDSQFEPFFYP